MMLANPASKDRLGAMHKLKRSWQKGGGPLSRHGEAKQRRRALVLPCNAAVSCIMSEANPETAHDLLRRSTATQFTCQSYLVSRIASWKELIMLSTDVVTYFSKPCQRRQWISTFTWLLTTTCRIRNTPDTPETASILLCTLAAQP